MLLAPCTAVFRGGIFGEEIKPQGLESAPHVMSAHCDSVRDMRGREEIRRWGLARSRWLEGHICPDTFFLHLTSLLPRSHEVSSFARQLLPLQCVNVSLCHPHKVPKLQGQKTMDQNLQETA